MSPKIEEIVESLRGCALDVALTCDKCVATGEMTCRCSAELMCIAADLIEQLQQELIDERYRHDRYADFCVAQGEELRALKSNIVRCKDCDRRGEEGCPMMFRERIEVKHDWIRWSEYEPHDQTEPNGFCHMGVKKREVKPNE